MPPFMEQGSKETSLKRSLSLFEATTYAVGIILGAGIYALIGQAAGIAGNAVWLSFLFAAVVAALTAFSYAELSSMFPKSAAEFVYVKKASGRELLAFMAGYISIFTMVVAASTVALGFGGYFSAIFGAPPIAAAIALIAVFSVVNFIGIEQSAKLNILFTAAELFGLLLVIVVGLPFIGGIDYFALPVPVANPFEYLGIVLAGTALVFFAYLGFEDTANISEETINPRHTVPRALLLALLISTLLYILVAVVAVSVVPSAELASSNAPLAAVAETALPGSGALLAIIALLATGNTVLITLIVASRMLYGMSAERTLPRFLSIVHPRTRTPHYAILFTALVAILFALSSGIKTVALMTDLGIFILFFAVNASLVALRYTMPKAQRIFTAPLNIGRFPVTAALGALFCLFMVFQFSGTAEIGGLSLPLLPLSLLLFLLSIPLYYALKFTK